MKRFATRLFFCAFASSVVFCALGSVAHDVRAADAVDDASRGTARKLGYAGVAAYQAGDYRTANDKLEKAYAVLRVPSIGLWSARALVKLGKLVEASERYTQVAQLGAAVGDEAVQKRALADAASELASLTPKIPSITVRLEGAAPAEVQVQIDGVPVAEPLLGEARPVNPGPHQVAGQRAAERTAVDLVLAEAESKPAVLHFQSVPVANPAAAAPRAAVASDSVTSPDSPSSSNASLGQQRIAALIAGGAGVVGVGIGAVFGLKSKSDHDEATKACASTQCSDPQGVSAGNDARSAGNISTVAMIVGGVALAGGAVLWFTAPRSNAEPSARVGVGVGSLQLQGRF